ncbi:MAG: endo-1,4-beta-xylanase [Fimbriimonadaceae bacterium]|nr:endo-1,4-beta-xylanase [Fimbriimonadaceae bacterium]
MLIAAVIALGVQASSLLGQGFLAASSFKVVPGVAIGRTQEGFRVVVDRVPEGAPYASQIRIPLGAPIAKDDLAVLSFEARCLDKRIARFEPIFEVDREPWTKSLQASLSLDASKWTRFSLPFRAAEGYGAPDAALKVNVNYGPQRFEIRSIRLVNHGAKKDLTGIETIQPYAGEAPDAPWRAEAAARIEKYRKAPLTVRVVDGKGRPVAGANVQIQQTRSAFDWGTAVSGWALKDGAQDVDRYRRELLANFDVAVLENHHKWEIWERHREEALWATDWLAKNGLPIRGHNLVWAGPQYLPKDVFGLEGDALRRRIRAHFEDVLGALKGKCYEWDVLNEPYDNHLLQGRIAVPGVPPAQGKLNPAEMVTWFRWAKELDPRAKRWLNDYALWQGDDEVFKRYSVAVTRWLLEQGAPLDGYGIQAHFSSPKGIPGLLDDLRRLDGLPIKLKVTEYDFKTLDEALQARYLRDAMTVAFADPRFDGFFLWGFWDGAHWMPNGGLFRRDWSARPSLAVWRDLTKKAWRTRVSARSARDGTVKTRGYLGAYRVSVKAGGFEKEATIALDAKGAAATVRLGR